MPGALRYEICRVFPGLHFRLCGPEASISNERTQTAGLNRNAQPKHRCGILLVIEAPRHEVVEISGIEGEVGNPKVFHANEIIDQHARLVVRIVRHSEGRTRVAFAVRHGANKAVVCQAQRRR